MTRTQLVAKFLPRAHLRSALLPAFMLIPGIPADDWRIEHYAHIPANTVAVSDAGMNVSVRASAGPIVYTFEQVRQIKGFRVSGSFSGLPRFGVQDIQGDDGADDFPLRIGFVVAGDKRLNFVQRLVAADWVKRLYTSAPEGVGLDRVQFYTLSQRPELIGQTRVHPDSDLVHETFFASVRKPGPFHYEYQLARPLQAVAVWISMDGDDTRSNYDIKLTELEIE